MTISRKLSAWWSTIDFRPVATEGWRVCWIWDRGRYEVQSLAGWLIQERFMFDADDQEYEDEDVPRMGRPRRAIPAVVSEGHGWAVEAIDDNAGNSMYVLKVLAPGEDEPGEAEREAFMADREKKRAIARMAAQEERVSEGE